jgi:hypothetical protein
VLPARTQATACSYCLGAAHACPTAPEWAQPLEGARCPRPRAPGTVRTRPHDVASPRCVRAHTHGRRTGLLRVEWFSLQAPLGNTPKDYAGERFFRDAGAAHPWRLRVFMCALWQLEASRPRRKTPAFAGPSAPSSLNGNEPGLRGRRGTDAVGARMQWLRTCFMRCVRAIAANAAWASSVCAPACGGVRRSEACVLVCVCTCLPRAKLLRRHSWPQNGARTWYQVRVRCRFRWCMINAGLQILKSQYRDFTVEIE